VLVHEPEDIFCLIYVPSLKQASFFLSQMVLLTVVTLDL
jgi:hypothetical protein